MLRIWLCIPLTFMEYKLSIINRTIIVRQRKTFFVLICLKHSESRLFFFLKKNLLSNPSICGLTFSHRCLKAHQFAQVNSQE